MSHLFTHKIRERTEIHAMRSKACELVEAGALDESRAAPVLQKDLPGWSPGDSLSLGQWFASATSRNFLVRVIGWVAFINSVLLTAIVIRDRKKREFESFQQSVGGDSGKAADGPTGAPQR